MSADRVKLASIKYARRPDAKTTAIVKMGARALKELRLAEVTAVSTQHVRLQTSHWEGPFQPNRTRIRQAANTNAFKHPVPAIHQGIIVSVSIRLQAVPA